MTKTYEKLLKELPSTKGIKLPTAKQLSGTEILWNHNGITIYANGFYTYTDGVHTTVYGVDRCMKRTKEFKNYTNYNFSDEEWLQLNFEIVLFAFGDFRVYQNCDRYASKHCCSCNSVEEEGIYLKDKSDFAAEFEVIRMLDILSDKQKMVVYMFFYCGMTKKSIAETMKITPQAVTNLYKKAIAKLQKYF